MSVWRYSSISLIGGRNMSVHVIVIKIDIAAAVMNREWLEGSWIVLCVTGHRRHHSPVRAVVPALGGCTCTTAVSPCWPLGSARWRPFPPVPWWRRTQLSCLRPLYTCKHVKNYTQNLFCNVKISLLWPFSYSQFFKPISPFSSRLTEKQS